MELIDTDPRNPAQQPSAPRIHWTKEMKAFQCAEFATTVVYWLCEDHWDGMIHIEITECRVTWYLEDEGQPKHLEEDAREFLKDYYSDHKIIFE